MANFLKAWLLPYRSSKIENDEQNTEIVLEISAFVGW